jgi:hypothetical protein
MNDAEAIAIHSGGTSHIVTWNLLAAVRPPGDSRVNSALAAIAKPKPPTTPATNFVIRPRSIEVAARRDVDARVIGRHAAHGGVRSARR